LTPLSALPAAAESPALEAVQAEAAPAALRDLQELGAAPQTSQREISDRVFDGSEAPVEESVDPETVTREIAGPAEPALLDLRFSRDVKERIKSSGLYATARLVGGSGSQWYWGKFVENAAVRVMVGGQTMFLSRVTSGQTKEIGKLTKADLAGVYAADEIKSHTVAQLRRRLIDDLAAYNRYSKPGLPVVIGLTSQVRVVRFLPYGEARQLPENQEEEVYEPKLRQTWELPAALETVRNSLPKAVLLDMRLFDDAVPAELVEDMSKLMKAGVYFVLLSQRRDDAKGSIEELLTKGLTNRQRDNIARYKMVLLSDDGNALSSYKGLFPAALPMPRFAPQELEIMEFAARRLGAARIRKTGTDFSVTLQPKADAAVFAKDLKKAMRQLAVPSQEFQLSVGRDDRGLPTLSLRPNTLASAVPHLLASLRDHEDLFVNPSDLLVVSRDEALLQATRGAVQPALHSQARGSELADLSFAAMLGKYRDNMSGDLAASASKIAAFQKNKDAAYGGGGGNVYMMMGHVMHAAFNWAVWVYRNTGILPDAEALVTRGNRNWAREDGARIKNMVEHPGETMDGYREVMEARLRTMHKTVSDILQRYPIAIGTELPNLFVRERFKKGQLVYRDVLRLIYDFVVARETPQGLEVAIVDFKTGQTPSLQNLDKDVQVQLYDIAARALWKNLPLPYASGALRAVSKTGLIFVYPTGGYEPVLDEWSRIKYEKFLRNVMDRIRKHNDLSAQPAQEGAVVR